MIRTPDTLVVDTAVGIGEATTPEFLLDIVKDQDGITDFRVYNANTGTGAIARAFLRATTAQLFPFAAGDNWTGVAEFAGKSGMYTASNGGNLVLAARTSDKGIDFYTGGSGSGNRRMVLNSSGQLGIGTTSPATSAQVEISSTTGAFLPPRMTTTQRDALTPAAGMMVFNTSTSKFQGYDGTSWVDLH